MVEARQNRLLKNSIYSLLSWLFPLVPTFIVTPIIVKGLGNEMYGIYTLIISFLGYFFTLGVGKAAAKYVAEYRATGETEKISDIVSSTILFSLLLGVLGCGSLCIFARIMVADVLLVSAPLQDVAVLALYLTCANILVCMVYQLFLLILQGLIRFDKYLLMMNLYSVSTSIGFVVLVLWGYGILSLLVFTLVVALVIAVLSYQMAHRLLPEFKFTFRVSRESWTLIWRYAASIMAYQIFGNALLLFERGWIMRRFGPEALTYYAVPMTLGMYIHLFTSNLVIATFPTINALLTEPEKLAALYKKTTKMILMLVVFAVLSAIVCGRMFLGLWMNDEFARMSHILLTIHVLTFGLLAMNTIVWQIAESFRKASYNAFATLAWMAIAIPLMVILSDSMGSVGIALGRLAGVLVFVPLIFLVEKRFLGGVLLSFWTGVAIRVILSAAAAVAVEEFALYIVPNGWPSFVIAVALGFAAYVAVLFVSGFLDVEDRQMFRNLLARVR